MSKVEVVAKTMGQTPDGAWVREGEKFEIDADKVSHIWMTRADGKPWPADKAKPVDGDAKALTVENEKLKADADKAQADLAAVTAERDALRAQLADAEKALQEAQLALDEATAPDAPPDAPKGDKAAKPK